MVLMVLAALLILAVAFYQAAQGLFSAMIMVILTVLSAAIAFNYFDALAGVLAGRLGAYAHGVALLATFAIPLLALRELFDRLIRGNVDLGAWASRLGGGALGILTGMIIVGMCLIVVQLLPLPGTIVTYQPYDSALESADAGPVRWAGDFTLGLMKLLSRGSLRPLLSSERLGLAHEDLQLEAFCARSRPKGARADSPPNALEVAYARVVPAAGSEAARGIADKAGLERLREAAPGYRRSKAQLTDEDTKVLVVRVKVDEQARHEEDDWFRLPATQFRLVTKRGRSFYPVAYLTYAGAWQVNTSSTETGKAEVADIIVARQWTKEDGPKKLVVDWLYRLPADAKPDYLVFRRTAGARVQPPDEGMPQAAVQGTTPLKPMPVRLKAEFAGGPEWLLAPVRAQVTDSLPENLVLRFFPPEQRPAPIKDMAEEDGRLKSIEMAGAWGELMIQSTAKRLRNFLLPADNYMMVQVWCNVVPGQALSAKELGEFTPRLLLDAGPPVAHKGAVVFYKDAAGKRQAYWYYDSAGKDRPLAPALADNAAKAETVLLQFVVPVDAQRSIVGLRWDTRSAPATARVFLLARPLACHK